jgi:hypothetical protein
MISILEYILGYVLLFDNIKSIWDGISPYLPQKSLEVLAYVELLISSRYILPFIVIYLVILFWKMKLGETKMRLDYRFSDNNAKLLKLPPSYIENENGEVTNIFLIGGINSSICRAILSGLNCKILIIFESTPGITFNVERQYTGFEIIESPHKLIVSSDIELSGTNKIELGIMKEDMSPFYNDGVINMRVCIGPTTSRYIRILQAVNGILCESKIDIA